MTFQQLQARFAGLVTGSAPQPAPGVLPGLRLLLESLPCYGHPGVESAHRGALSAVLQAAMANPPIAAQPPDSGSGYYITYSYEGPFSGYADAFFPKRAVTPASTAVTAAVRRQKPVLDQGWWQTYALAVLTDAARQAAGIPLHTGKLTADLAALHTQFLPALTASYLAALQTAYEPTAAALRALAAAGQLVEARAQLGGVLAGDTLIANLNGALGVGGDSTNAAVWFLYNLWVLFKALGSPDVDAEIRALRTAGLTVPGQVAEQSWWNGGYTTWYAPLSGSAVVPATAGTLTAGLPELVTSSYASKPPMPPVREHEGVTNGYSRSLCLWGPLNRYRPQPSSCLGAGTGVLMADGSVKPIEDVRIGDEVRSGGGTGTVVLAERPGRLGRPLYSVNGLAVFATAGHPFRSAEGPLRRAVDPWNLADAVPTMIADGIGSLGVGARLDGYGPDGPGPVTVRTVTAHEPDPAEYGEVVYDLVVATGDRGHGGYYAGGPTTFVAVDAESADPFHDTASTLAVVAAMDVALESVREHVDDPHADLLDILGDLDLSGIGEAAGGTGRPEIPGPGYYLRDGEWDPHASALETDLIRVHGRTLRRHCATGRRADADPGGPFTVCLHDVELVGDLPRVAVLEVELRVRGDAGDVEDVVRWVTVPAVRKRPGWSFTPDTDVDFGPPPSSAFLLGFLYTEGKPLGRFGLPVSGSGYGEHFVFGDDGTVIGRVALGRPGAGPVDRPGTSVAWDRAVAAGRQLGDLLARRVRPRR
ncbi:hypothetical protein ABZ342_21550 [Amycolatopsis sp. NPDC005961]|uniref:Hint domain-containing protein n=1 Tax=Amycolatopsis sp. NPDC005961 TaxID=3156720 RepID=UPI0033E4F732